MKSADTSLWPDKVIIDLTGRCNYHCAVCRPHTDDGGPRFDMSDTAFARLEPAVRRAREVELGGNGEPLLAQGFEDRLGRLREWNPRAAFTIISNGSLLFREDLTDRLTRSVDRVHISVNAWGRYAEATGGGSRERLEAGLQLLSERRRRAGRPAYVEIGTVLTRGNLDAVVANAELAKRFGFDRVAYKDLLVTRPGLQRESLRHDPALATALRGEVERARAVGVPIRCEPWPELTTAWMRPRHACAMAARRPWPSPAQLRYLSAIARSRLASRLRWLRSGARPPCVWPWEVSTAFHDGRVMLCCLRPVRLGNLDEETFEAIWNSERANRYRQGLLARAPFGECAACQIIVPDRPAAYESFSDPGAGAPQQADKTQRPLAHPRQGSLLAAEAVRRDRPTACP